MPNLFDKLLFVLLKYLHYVMNKHIPYKEHLSCLLIL